MLNKIREAISTMIFKGIISLCLEGWLRDEEV